MHFSALVMPVSRLTIYLVRMAKANDLGAQKPSLIVSRLLVWFTVFEEPTGLRVFDLT